MYEVLRRQPYYIAVLNSAKMQTSQSLFSHFHGEVGLPHSNFDYIKACTDFFSLLFRQNAPFTVLVFILFCNSKQFQIPSQRTICGPCFHLFSAVPNRFKYRHHACFRDIVLIYFSAVPNRFKYDRMHALETLFLFFSAVQNRFK